MSDVFFIVGCGRSGTTAYARILNLASNAEVFIEQSPRLRFESRQVLNGNLPDPAAVLFQAKDRPIREVLGRGLKYGDKNPCYMPFLPYIDGLWDSKIVFLVRDGRDVVRSLMEWNAFRTTNIFGRKEDEEDSQIVEPSDDPWDYSRPRPNPGDPHFDEWRQLSRFEKCCWYWANFNSRMLGSLAAFRQDSWTMVDVSRSGPELVERLGAFLELEGLDPKAVEEMLASKINSLEGHIPAGERYPRWDNWTRDQTRLFARHAADMMARLQYW